MRTTINHIPPETMQPEPVDNTTEHVMAQVHTWAAGLAPSVAYRARLAFCSAPVVHTQAAMEIAAWWQSPGPHGIGMARFASTGTITDDLFDDITREIDAYRVFADPGDATETARNLTALQALDAYVRVCMVTVWTVGHNMPGYSVEDVSFHLTYADAVDRYRRELDDAPGELYGPVCQCEPATAVDVPDDFLIRPIDVGTLAGDPVTCGTCGRMWDDAIATQWTPAPSGRCPFESFHDEDTGSDEMCDLCVMRAEIGAYRRDGMRPGEADQSITFSDSAGRSIVYWLTRTEESVSAYLNTQC